MERARQPDIKNPDRVPRVLQQIDPTGRQPPGAPTMGQTLNRRGVQIETVDQTGVYQDDKGNRRFFAKGAPAPGNFESLTFVGEREVPDEEVDNRWNAAVTMEHDRPASGPVVRPDAPVVPVEGDNVETRNDERKPPAPKSENTNKPDKTTDKNPKLETR